MHRTNYHIYPSPMLNESRMLRETLALKQAGYFAHIVLLGVWDSNLAGCEAIDDVRQVVRLRACGAGRGLLGKACRTLTWMMAVFLYLLPRRVACINCHSLSVLPLCALLSVIKRSRLIYDTHELETEAAAAVGARKRLAKIMEWALIRLCDRVIVVSPSIGAWYRTRYGLDNVHVVRNVPEQQPVLIERDPSLRRGCGIGAGDRVFLYQGLLARGRGIDLLLEVFAAAPRDQHLVFMGFGRETEKIQEAARRSPNIHYHPAVAPAEVNRYTGGADVGIALIEDVCLSYYYCLPNKVFEYLGCGLPIIVSDFPDMARLVDETGAGWKVAVEAPALQALLRTITPADIAARRQNALAQREQLVWDVEKHAMLVAYAGLYPALATCG